MPKKRPSPGSSTRRSYTAPASRKASKPQPRRTESDGDRLLRETMNYKLEMVDRFAPGSRKNK